MWGGLTGGVKWVGETRWGDGVGQVGKKLIY